MGTPGFTAEAALYQRDRQFWVDSAGTYAIPGSVKPARVWPEPIDEEIVAVCGPCKCRSYGSGKSREFICSRNCCSPRERGCESWSIPCAPRR
jgi:hypothetical protein